MCAEKVMNKEYRSNEEGFTLLEVILTIVILLTLSVAATNMIRGSLNMKTALSQSAKVTQRLSVTMDRVVTDLTHSFIVNTKAAELNWAERETKTIFKVKMSGESSELYLTTMTHRSLRANSYETDQTYVVYKLEEDKKISGRTNLYRGETKVLPENFRDEIPMELLAKDIKEFKIEPWTGDGWSKDGWNSNRSEHRNMLPRMVRVTIIGWEEEVLEGDNPETYDDITTKLITSVFIPKAIGMKQLKDPVSSPSYKF